MRVYSKRCVYFNEYIAMILIMMMIDDGGDYRKYIIERLTGNAILFTTNLFFFFLNLNIVELHY